MSKKFLFRKFNWYIGRKMTNLLSDPFWLRHFACITLVNPHRSPRWVGILTSTLQGKVHSEAFNELKMTWLVNEGPHPDSNSEEYIYSAPERRERARRDISPIFVSKTAHRQSLLRAVYKDFHKCHNLNNLTYKTNSFRPVLEQG